MPSGSFERQWFLACPALFWSAFELLNQSTTLSAAAKWPTCSPARSGAMSTPVSAFRMPQWPECAYSRILIMKKKPKMTHS